jgi:large repetitive protein
VLGWQFLRRPTTLLWATLIGASTLAVAVFAIRSPGYSVADVSLNDGGVWVTYNDPNDETQPPVGRFDKPIGQLSDGLTAPGGAQTTYQVDIYQSGSNVLLFDGRKESLFAVDAAAVAVKNATAGVRVPGRDQIALGGETAAVLDPKSGKVWTTPADALDGFAPGAARADARAGPDAGVAVTVGGTVFVASAVGHRLVSIPPGDAKPSIKRLRAPTSPDPVSVTAVGSTAVLLDARTRTVVIPSRRRTVQLPASQATLQTLVLQEAGPAASEVLVADATTLYSVPLSGGDPVALARVGNGLPAAPVRVAGCDYGAWAGTRAMVARACDGLTLVSEPLSSAKLSIGRLIFRVNRDQLVLNDPDHGYIWSVDARIERLDGWNDVKAQQRDLSKNLRIRNHETHSHSSQDRAPVLKADQLGVRFAQSTILHPLDNDYDPDGDILAIDSVTQVDDPYAHADVVSNGQAVKFTVDGGPPRDIHFRYTVDDGRGKSASAQDTIRVYPTNENSAPSRLATAPNATLKLASGETTTIPVLSDWRDPNGDSLFISSATAPQGSVSISGGSLSYTAGPPGPQTIAYAVSDGSIAVQKAIHVVVLKPNAPAVPPAPLPDVVATQAGSPVTIYPLANDQPGADPTDPSAQLTLEGDVSAPAGVTVSADPATGTLTATARRAQTYLLTYTEAFGSTRPVIGKIRLDVSAPEAARPPITLPDVAVLRGQVPTVIDPIANDVDPQNAMLVVQSATVDGGAPVEVAVEDHHWLKLRSTQAAAGANHGGSGNFLVHYTVSDGLSAAVEGDVVASQQPAAAKDLPPTASPDSTVVRAGSSTAIDVLSNDSDPEDEQLTLQPGKLKIHAADGRRVNGSAWAVDGLVRYVAPPGSAVAVSRRVEIDYLVHDTAQNAAIGQVFVTINPLGTAKRDSPPAPLPIEARLEAGQQAALPIPTYDVDPDGDPVTFRGIATAPKLGRIVSSGPDSLVYQAYPESSGTDRFSYQVVDPFGEVGTASVQISIAPATPAQAPVAADDEAFAAPGRTVHVDVLNNDLIADGDPVTLALARGSAGSVRVLGNRIVVRAPLATAPPLRIRYVLADGNGATSAALLTVRGVAGADNPPVARDDYPPQPPAGATAITLDVRANDDDPDDPRNKLRVSPLALGVRSVGGGRLHIVLGLRPRLVAYTLSDGRESSEAFVHVPAAREDRPAVRQGAPAIQVAPGGSRQVSLASYVSDPRGRVRLTTLDTLHATPESSFRIRGAGPSALVVSAVAGYHGPGAISFEVTDGKTLGDPTGRRAVLTLPVRAGPEAPVLRCPATPFSVVVGAAPVNVDLGDVCLVWLDEASKLRDLRYRATVGAGGGSVVLRRQDSIGRRVAINAPPSAKAGTVVPVRVTVSGVGQATSAQLLVKTIAAALPTIRPVSLNGTVGHPVTFDAAATLTSPFGTAARPKVLGVRSPAGVSVSTSGTQVTITPRVAGTLTLAFRITDVSGRSERAVSGTVTLRVQSATVVQSSRVTGSKGTGKENGNGSKPKTTTVPAKTPAKPKVPQSVVPDTPGIPYSTNVGSGQVVLAWTVPASNGNPIDKYQVADAAGDLWPCAGSPCTVDSNLKNGQTYQFKVAAHNTAGWSQWSDLSQLVTPDAVPDVVATVSADVGDGSAHVTWVAPTDPGSPITGYDVQIGPAPSSGSPDQTVSASEARFSGLTNGTAYSFRVRSENKAGWGDWSAASASVTPFGAPAAMAAPSASGVDSADPHEKAITVNWAAADGNGRPISQYTVTPRSSLATSGATAATVDGGTLQATFDVPNDGASWTYTVTATNSGGKSSPESPPSAAVAAHSKPDAVASVTASDNTNGTGLNGAVNLTFTVPITNGLSATSVDWQSSAGSSGSQALATGSAGTVETFAVSGLTNGTQYTFAVAVCNADGCGGFSPGSNAVTPYGPPGAPSAGAGASGTTITYSWSGGGGGGRPIANYQISIDGGGWQNEGPNPGSTSAGYGYSETHSVQVRVVDTANQISGVSNTASARTADAPPPPETISISKGGAASVTGCTSGCYYVNVSMSNFTSPRHLRICDSASGCSTWYGPWQSGVNNFFADGHNGGNVWIESDDGVTSNHLNPF